VILGILSIFYYLGGAPVASRKEEAIKLGGETISKDALEEGEKEACEFYKKNLYLEVRLAGRKEPFF